MCGLDGALYVFLRGAGKQIIQIATQHSVWKFQDPYFANVYNTGGWGGGGGGALKFQKSAK